VAVVCRSFDFEVTLFAEIFTELQRLVCRIEVKCNLTHWATAQRLCLPACPSPMGLLGAGRLVDSGGLALLGVGPKRLQEPEKQEEVSWASVSAH
jgi:hypothetical protein